MLNSRIILLLTVVIFSSVHIPLLVGELLTTFPEKIDQGATSHK